MKRILLIISTLFLISCTSALWQKPHYEERILGFYFATQESLLIVEGQNYSYVFDSNPQLQQVLLASRNMEFSPQYRHFRLDKTNNMNGQLRLTSYKESDKQTLTQLGFTPNKYGQLEKTFDLQGKRYVVEGNFPFQRLQDEHFLSIETPESATAKAGKIIATPATVTIDAVGAITLGSAFAILGIMNAADR